MNTKFSKLFGEFNKQGVFVDIKNNVTLQNVLATAIHEKTHSFLEYDTNLGQFEFLLQQIISDLAVPREIRERLCNWKNKLFDVSLHVQESVAVCWELSFLQCFDVNAYEDESNEYRRRRQDYYVKYRFKDLEELMDDSYDLLRDYSEKRIEEKATNILFIAKRAMNIPLNGLVISAGGESIITKRKELYDASYRFFKVIDYIKEKKINIEKLDETDIDKLFVETGLPIEGNFEIDNFADWATNHILIPNNLREYSYYVSYESISNPEDLIFDINCYVSEDEYKHKNKNNFDKDEVNRAKIYAILYDYYVTPILSCLIDTDKCTDVISQKDYDKNIARIVKIIFTDRSSYFRLLNEHVDVLNYCLFVDLGNWDLAARKFLKEVIIEGYCIYRINENFAFVLLKGEKEITYLISMPIFSVSLFQTTYLKEYVNLIKWWGTAEQLKYMYAYMLKESSANICIDNLSIIE